MVLSLLLGSFICSALYRRSSNGEAVRSLFEREGLAGAPIPHSAREVREVGRFAGERSEIHLGTDAGEHLFKRRVGAGFRVVHLATHALLSERQPSRSALVLAADAAEEDGFLQAREISALSIPSDLVVLSGCRTARGRILAGEGVQSLARAFFEAGTPSVVATLWEVEDRAAADLMGAFYRQLAAGLPKTDALRAAKLEQIRGRSPSPRHWAAFVLLGDGIGTVKLSGAVAPAAAWARWARVSARSSSQSCAPPASRPAS